MRSMTRDGGNQTLRFIIEAADLVAEGAFLVGDILLANLKAGTRVRNATIHVVTPVTGVTTCTAAVGITGAGYTDIIAASDVKAAAGTDYAQAASPLFTADSDVYCHLITTVENLSAVLTGEFVVVLETAPVYND